MRYHKSPTLLPYFCFDILVEVNKTKQIKHCQVRLLIPCGQVILENIIKEAILRLNDSPFRKRGAGGI